MSVGSGGGVNSVRVTGRKKSARRALHHPYSRAFCTLPSFARIKRQRWRPVEFNVNDRHLLSHGKIGDCEQSIRWMELYKYKDGMNVYHWTASENFPVKRSVPFIGVRGGAGGGALQPPLVSDIFVIFRAKRWWFGQEYSGKNILKGCQGQACGLLSLTFALSKWS